MICRNCEQEIPKDWKEQCPNCGFNHILEKVIEKEFPERILKIYPNKIEIIFNETGNVSDCMESRYGKEMGPHEVLRVCAEEKLKKMNYGIVRYGELPNNIKEKIQGIPDICALRDREWVFVEIIVTGRVHIGNYVNAGKVIIVLPIENAEKIEVWGFREIEK